MRFCSFQFQTKKKAQRLDYYIGSTDSCQGDSGGPLFTFHSKKRLSLSTFLNYYIMILGYF